jgi:transposase
MTVYEELRRRPATFRCLTGMTVSQFEQQYEQVASDIESHEEKRLRRPDRKRAIGGGASHRLDGRDRVLMALIWLRVYPTYEVLGFIFDLHKSNVGRNLKPILEVLSKHLEIEWPDKAKRTKKKMNEFMQEFPEVAVIGDATEQPTCRPTGRDTQQRYYSGRKKRHTLKTQVVVLPDGTIAAFSDTVPGSQHDKSLYDASGLANHLDQDEAIMGDSGYQGIQHDHRAVLPDKKPKGGELTDDQKARNHQISQARIVVENTIAQLKSFRVFADRYRHPRDSHNWVFGIVVGLVNQRIARRPLRVVSA